MSPATAVVTINSIKLKLYEGTDMTKLTDANYLYEGYLNSRKNSQWKPDTQKYGINWLYHIAELREKLQNETYRTQPGSEFIQNERGHKRVITSKKMDDKIVRHVLCDDILIPQIEPLLIHDNGASRVGMGIDFQRKRFDKHIHDYVRTHGSNDGWIVLGDFSKYYDNILHSIIKEIFSPFLEKDELWLLDEIINQFKLDVSYMSEEEFSHIMEEKFNSLIHHERKKNSISAGEKFIDKSVDIGDQLSQVIGIFYPNRMDHYIKTVCGEKYYGRYMDDWYIISDDKEKLKEYIIKITEYVKPFGIFINEKKTKIMRLDKEFTFLQTKYNISETGHIDKRIPKRAIIRERRRLKKYKTKLDQHVMTYEDIENAYKSWMASFYKKMSSIEIHNIKDLFKQLFGKDPRWKK